MHHPPDKDALCHFLEKVSLFAKAGKDVLTHLAGKIRLASFPPGTTVIVKGDEGESMYLILSGSLKVHDGEHAVATLSAGQFFGELSLLDREPRSMSVTTLEATELGRIDRKDFYDVLKVFPEMTGDIIAVLNGRLRNQNQVLIREYQSREEQLTELVRIRTEEVIRQSAVIADKNREMTESLNYASRLQAAMLPGRDALLSYFPQSFVLYLPKDIVSGDFYFLQAVEHCILVAAADCTGHGVSGAIMSMLGHSLLRQLAVERQMKDPAPILLGLNEGVIESLKQAETNTHDGMDIALCAFDTKGRTMTFAGANRPLWRMRKGVLEAFTSDKLPIGGLQMERSRTFTNHPFDIQAGDTFYLFSDGYADQFGGEHGKKMMTKRLKEIILSIQHMEMSQQRDHLYKFFKEWKGQLEQVDDVLVIGIRIV